jgi:hypothetical protein
MASIYVVHSRVIALCEHPFCYQDKLRPVWRPFFQSAKGFAPFIPSSMHNLSKHPFLNTLGPLVFNSRRAVIVHGEKSMTYHWLEDRLSGAAFGSQKTPRRQSDDTLCEIFGFDPRQDDHRQSLLYLECARSIPLRSAGRHDVRARGNFYAHVYPAGYLVLHLALTLDWQQPRSLPEVVALLGETCPWRSDGTWRWESHLANGKIHYLYLRLRTALFSAFFESHQTPLRESEWKTFVSSCSGQDPMQMAEILWNGGDFGGTKADIPGLQSLVLSGRGAVIGFDSSDTSNSRHLKIFWRVLHLAESVFLTKQIHADIFTRMLHALKEMQPFVGGQIPFMESNHDLEESALDGGLLHYLMNLKGYSQCLKPAMKAINEEISHWFGLEGQYRDAMAEITAWHQLMNDWDPAFVTAWNPVYETLQEIFPSLLLQ